VVYDENVVVEARMAKELLLKVSSREVEAYTKLSA